VFYKAREGMGKVDVIVTNHDMVLADLALGGGAVLPDPRDTMYVFDEGHHLPDKAIGHFAHYSRLRSTADWLEQTAKNLTKLLAQHPLPGDLGADRAGAGAGAGDRPSSSSCSPCASRLPISAPAKTSKAASARATASKAAWCPSRCAKWASS
jgi:Rad3-related DNA helicase